MELGRKQKLKIVKQVEFGVYMAEDEGMEERVLLPRKQVPEGAAPGDEVEVFLYRDSKDRLIATTNEPKLQLGEIAMLRVAQVGKIGAFLDWGLEKELFLPFREQTTRVREGDLCLAALYIDKSSRLCATMNVYPWLRTDSPYQKEDRVRGRIYETSQEFGLFVAVDNIYSALIPKKEAYGDLKIGDDIEARVIRVHEDGKLDLSVREKAWIQIEKDAEKVMQVIESYDGALPFNDRANPEVINRELGMSKNEFKRAVGHLLKNKRIVITDRAIRKTEEGTNIKSVEK